MRIKDPYDLVRRYDVLMGVDCELDGDDLDEIRGLGMRVLMVDEEGDRVFGGESGQKFRKLGLPPVMGGRLMLPLETGCSLGVPSLISSMCCGPLCQFSATARLLSLSTSVSVNECEIESCLCNVIALALALGVGDT